MMIHLIVVTNWWGLPQWLGGRVHLPLQVDIEMWVESLDQEDPLQEGMATHSGILAWRIPWTEEPGRLQSTGMQSQTRLSRLSMYTHTRELVLFLSWVIAPMCKRQATLSFAAGAVPWALCVGILIKTKRSPSCSA